MTDPGWTLLSLKEHFEALMHAKDVKDAQRYDASQKALDAALLSADRAVQAALQAAKEAVTKAELSADKRFELLNELRVGVATTDQLEALEKVVGDLAKRVDMGEGAVKGGQAKLAGIYAALAAAVAVLAIVVFAANGVFTR